MHFRNNKLDLTKMMRIDEETHCLLRLLKKRYKQSMAQIVKDLIKKEYDTRTKTKD